MAKRTHSKNSDTSFKTLVEHLGEPLWLLDADSKPLYANKAARQIEQREPDVLTWARTDTTLLICDESGTKHFWHGQSDPMPDGQNMLRLVEVSREAHLKEELRILSERYTMLTEHAADVLWTMELDGRFSYVSPTGKDLRGYNIDELMDQPISETIVPEDYNKVMGALAERMKIEAQGIHEPFTERFDVRQYAREGGLVWTEVIVSPLRDEKQELIGILGVTRNIDARKRIEEALRESEQRYRLVVENMADVVLGVDLSLTPFFVSPSAKRVFGYTVEETMQLGPKGLMTPESLQLILNSSNGLLGKDKNRENPSPPPEVKVRRKDGVVIQCESHARFLRHADGTPYGIVALIQDISERKAMEAALSASEKRFRAIIESSQDVLYRQYVSDGRLEYISPSMFTILGYTTEELLNLPPEKQTILFHPDEEPVYSLYKSKRILHGSDSPYYFERELRMIRKSGEMRWIHGTYRITLDDRGEAEFIVGTLKDITTRKMAEQALAKRERDLRAILDTTNDIAFLVDLQQKRVVEANEKLLHLIGVSHEELLKLDFYGFMQEKGWLRRAEVVLETIDTKTMHHGLDTMNGRHYEHNLYPITDDQGTVIRLAIFSRDITEQYEAQRNLIHYQQRLRALASQLTLAEERQRREFAIWLHDGIAQSLSALLLRLKLLRADHLAPFEGSADQPFAEILHDLEHAIQSTRSLIFDLSPPLLYEVGFKAAIGRLFEKLQSDIGCDGSFRVTPMPLELPHDRKVLLFQISRELLNNVRKHAHASLVEGALEYEDGQILFSLKDNGTGFDAQAIRENGFAQGGFGLFSIEERLRDIDGKLVVASKPGQGTTVVVYVPIPA